MTVVQEPLAPAWRRRPSARSAAVTVVVVLCAGIGIGAAIGPAAVGQTVAAQRPTIVVASAPAAPAPELAVPRDDTASTADEAGGASEPTAADVPEPVEEPPASPASEPPPANDGPATAGIPPAVDPPDDAGGDPPATDSAPPGSTALAGIVVAVAASGEGFTLSKRSGELLAIHASGCDVTPGDDVHLRARPLANGTWAADRMRRVRDAVAVVRAVGTVSWVDPAGGRYALAARGATLLVIAGEEAPPPIVGERLRVRLQVEPANGDLPASLREAARAGLPPQDPTAVGAVAPLELDGAIVSVDQQARSVVLALDAVTPPTATVTLAVPPALDLTRLLPAQRVAVTATLAPDGTYVLSGTSADGDASAADDAATAQGDQVVDGARRSGDPAQTVPPACTALGSLARRISSQ